MVDHPQRRARVGQRGPGLTAPALFALAAVAVAGGLTLTGCKPPPPSSAPAADRPLYTCSMHPQIVQDHPGNCPICGMTLTLRRDAAGVGDPTAGTAAAEPIRIDPVTIQNMGIRTATVASGPLRRTVRTVGTIEFDETALADVTTKFKGWIEKLHIDATGQQVHRGDPLFEIYSPELWSAQTEFLATLEEPRLHASALTKLHFFDISDEQIAALTKAGKPQKTLAVSAPIDGFVIDKMVVEGQMVEAGAKTYRIADLATVWVQSPIYEQDLGFIRLGQEATVNLSYLPAAKFHGRVTYLYPTIDEKTRAARVRMEFHNPGYALKPGMFATVEIVAEVAPAAVLVPESAVLRSGERNTVFVALGNGRFEPREIALGLRAADDQYQVLDGLRAGEQVVTSGQFMLDSESRLREAMAKMREPAPPGPAGDPAAKPSAATPAAPGSPPLAAAAGATYVCPMPEHLAFRHDAPGKCPICGMELVPVAPALLATLLPSDSVDYYTCPMPEHADVRSPRSGKCPRCRMTLIPVLKKMSPGAPPPTTTTPPATPKPALYTCPMASHADVVTDHPGKCPKCAMDLVPTTGVKHGAVAEKHWAESHEH